MRTWMGVDEDRFDNPSHIAIIAIGYYYPARGSDGELPQIEMTPLGGPYAQRQLLGNRREQSLTETAKASCEFSPDIFRCRTGSAQDGIAPSKLLV